MPPIEPQKSEVHDSTDDAESSPAATGATPTAGKHLRAPRGTVRISDVELSEATILSDETDDGGPLVIKSADPNLNPPRLPTDPFPSDGTPQSDLPL